MTAALRALLTEVIDYAGLFRRPSPLADAIRSFARYLREPDAWMLSRFIIPAAKLIDLGLRGRVFWPHPVRLSVLGRGGDTRPSLPKTCGPIWPRSARSSSHAPAAMVDAFESACRPLCG